MNDEKLRMSFPFHSIGYNKDETATMGKKVAVK